MNDTISHDGTVISIDDEHITVRIVQMAACASCKVAGYCSSAESKEKLVDVWTKDYAKYGIGDEVKVLAQSGVGTLAVIVGFVIPVVLVVLAVVVTLWLTGDGGVWPLKSPDDQGVAAVMGLVVLVPYYLGVYACRGMLKRKLTFTLSGR